MRIACALCGLALLVVAAPGLAQEEDGTVAPEDFVILPWGWTPGDLQQLEWIRECGFNLAGFVDPDALDLVQQAGLQAFVSGNHVGDAEAGLNDEEIARRVGELVDRVGDHPATFGYYLRDEPSSVIYPGLGRWKAAYKAANPDRLAYINLFPNYASPGQMGADTYEQYLERYVEQVDPEFISYDHYALMDDGTLRDGYFQNLEAVRRVSLAAGIPFWNIVLSNAHFRYAEPSPAGLRFQAYTTLAYGGRGISYFTYFAPKVGNYRLAPVDQFGNRTPVWDMLRNVNLQIHALAPAYCILRSVNVFHHGGEIPEGCSGIETSAHLESVDGENLLVGEFVGPDDQPAVLVVNKDLHISTTFGVRFKQPGRVQLVSPYQEGAVVDLAGEQGWLAPGQGSLLLLQPE